MEKILQHTDSHALLMQKTSCREAASHKLQEVARLDPVVLAGVVVVALAGEYHDCSRRMDKVGERSLGSVGRIGIFIQSHDGKRSRSFTKLKATAAGLL